MWYDSELQQQQQQQHTHTHSDYTQSRYIYVNCECLYLHVCIRMCICRAVCACVCGSVALCVSLCAGEWECVRICMRAFVLTSACLFTLSAYLRCTHFIFAHNFQSCFRIQQCTISSAMYPSIFHWLLHFRFMCALLTLYGMRNEKRERDEQKTDI